jgi:hypothetical protein
VVIGVMIRIGSSTKRLMSDSGVGSDGENRPKAELRSANPTLRSLFS